jgi:hypothetical protein
MPNQKISELTAIVTVDNSVDVLPIVDISANTTKKVTPNALKTALALDNVNNTSDANKPVSIAQQDALNAKVDENAPITAGTAPKITFDAKGLVTSGDSLDETDLPTGINANKIGTGAVSSTEFGYLDGVTSAIQTQIDGKQATLVSGTNIKTINSTSLLGSGDITISANPSGVSGAIQFSNGSAFASDATNLFWDDTNNRLGVGTNAPTQALEIAGGSILLSNAQSLKFKNTAGTAFDVLRLFSDNAVYLDSPGDVTIRPGAGIGTIFAKSSGNIGFGESAPSARVHIKGSGSTSATTSLLVQNSAGSQLLKVADNGETTIGNVIIFGGATKSNVLQSQYFNTFTNSFSVMEANAATGNARFYQFISVGKTTDPVASAALEVVSTSKGFLPPRMTTTEKNAIASPATGLVLYDSTTNKLQCYNGSTWNDLF